MKALGLAVPAVIFLVIGLVFIAWIAPLSYSQYYEDSEDEQVSEMSSEVDKEARGEEAESETDMAEMDQTLRGNEAPLGVADYE